MADRSDDKFEVRTGRIRSRGGGKRARSYLSRVARSASKSGPGGARRKTARWRDAAVVTSMAHRSLIAQIQAAHRYAEARKSGAIQGTYLRAIERPSGKFAVVERAKDLALVRWRKIMDRGLGKAVPGRVCDGRVSCTFGRRRRIRIR